MNDNNVNDSLSSPDAEDHRVRRDVAQALGATGLSVASRVHVSAANGVVRLQGHVASYYQKQLVQVAALQAIGAHTLVNDVEVA